jgi:hypothetical protein
MEQATSGVPSQTLSTERSPARPRETPAGSHMVAMNAQLKILGSSGVTKNLQNATVNHKVVKMTPQEKFGAQ